MEIDKQHLHREVVLGTSTEVNCKNELPSVEVMLNFKKKKMLNYGLISIPNQIIHCLV